MDDLRTENAEWENSWVLSSRKQDNLRGGQGTIKQVIHKCDGVVGALKELHDEHRNNTERRSRMLNEVVALKVLRGNGTPKIYDSNETLWENKDISLYAVMEWIEGPTLSQYVNNEILPLDDALIMIDSLINIIEECHHMDIYHRDIKPDNIILRGGKISEPVLVDFGMAWCKPNEDKDCNFITDKGQELGNRFLRLPEHAPDRHVYDKRSDLTLIVGLLFYSITGKPPRILRNANDKMPHESETLLQSLYRDPRWKKLNRLFEVGFQQSLDQRFQSPKQLRHYLASLLPINDQNSSLLKEKELLEGVLRLKNIEKHAQLANTIKSVSIDLIHKISNLGTSTGFQMTGSYTIDDAGLHCISNFGICLRDIPTPRISFSHSLKFQAGDYVAGYKISETQIQKEYYRGPSVDTDSLKEALTSVSREIYEHLIVIYRKTIEMKFS